MASRLFFNGQSYSSPSVPSRVDDAAEAPSNLTVGNVLALLGACTGGQPKKVYAFGDPSQVTPALLSGPLCDAAIKAFAPSAQTNAPGTVICVPIGEATPGTLTLLDADGSPAVLVTSTDYGASGNLPQVKIEIGSTTPGSVRVSVQSGQSYATADNLGGVVLVVSYNGPDASAEIGVGGNVMTVYGPNGPLGALAFTPFTVIQDIVNFVDAYPGFTAVAQGANGQTLALNLLDQLGFSLKTGNANFTANNSAVVKWLNGPAQGFVTATPAPPTNGVLLGPNLLPWTALAGGSNPGTTLADWVDGLNVLQSKDVQWIVPLTGDQAVWAATDAHVQYMSTVGQKERRALVGPPAGTAMAAALAMPVILNSDRTSVCWPGYYDFDVSGNLVLKDPFFAAACVAAGFAGSDPGTPMTNKAFAFRGLELDVRNPTDTDQLIQAGLLCFDEEPDGFKCVRSISSWLTSNNFNRVEVSTGAATDFMLRNVRQALAVLKGARGDPRILGRAITVADSALRLLAKPPPLGPGVIVGDAANPAYSNINASLAGDVLSVSWVASPVIPVNFIPCSVSLNVYSGSASA